MCRPNLPDYVFTADSTRRYRVTFDGTNANVNVVGNRFIISIRDGGASSPTCASPGRRARPADHHRRPIRRLRADRHVHRRQRHAHLQRVLRA
jgi:hypothetical protein